MQPTLLAGDRVVVVRLGPHRWALRPPVGALVAVPDPTEPARTLLKRVAGVGPEGVTVVGDNPSASTDSRSFGPVPRVWGLALYRYHPPSRAGRLRARR